MIGPSSGDSGAASSGGGGGDQALGDDQLQRLMRGLPTKRRVFEELDIESICDEVCGHHHLHLPPAKRPMLDQQIYAPLDFDTDLHQQQQQEQQDQLQCLQQEPVARLEVLVVDGTWDDALESFEAAAAAAATTQQSCSGTALAELTSATHHEHSLHLQQAHDIQNLQSVNFGDAFWGQDHHHHQQQQQLHQQPQPEPQPQQQQTTTTMPKIQSSESGRLRGGGFTGLSTAPSAPPTYEDQENGNLSWLLDFKLDSLIEAPEDKSTVLLPRDLQGNKPKFNGNNINGINGRMVNSYAHDSTKRSCNFEATGATRYENAFSPSAYGLAENRNRCTGPKKPPFTYTELIEHALQERGELTVSAIYQWISEHFPYYKSNDDRWKNSVRHNLSINPHFRKGSKAPHGAGHLWAIASQDESKPRQLFNIATIRQALKNEEAKALKTDSRVVTMDEVAAATASIAQPAEEENIVDTITLEHCAEQILSGIKREVEVQYLVPMMVSSNGEVVHNQPCQQNGQPDPLCPVKETDFLNPVSKEVVAEECGLIGEGYLVTDLNPSSLGLNMAESEIVTSDNLFGEELSFQFYEFASASSQLQSA